MAATFSDVNTSLSAPHSARSGEENTPTTPKPNARFASPPSKEAPTDGSAPQTPTRHSFGGVAGQRPLPNEPLTSIHTPDRLREQETSLKRDGSNRSDRSQDAGDSDVEMGEGDADEGAEDDGSDNESTTTESRGGKKKKGQRFFCTEFPPCQLSFTRSEHLARHIRYAFHGMYIYSTN